MIGYLSILIKIHLCQSTGIDLPPITYQIPSIQNIKFYLTTV